MAGVKFSVSVPGLKQLGVVYKDAAAVKLPEAVSEALGEVARAVVEDAKGKAPKRSGTLAGSIQATKSGAVMWRVGSRVKYANAIHWGVKSRAGLKGPHNIKPSLFLLNATLEHSEQAKAAGSTALGRLVEELE